MLEAKAARDSTAEALSFGHSDEPSPELLLRRGRATLFATGAEAEAALTKTIQESIKNGDQWPGKYRYKIVSVETDDTHLNTVTKKEWVGLTEEEKHDCYLRIDIWSRCVEMIEAKLREKNG